MRVAILLNPLTRGCGKRSRHIHQLRRQQVVDSIANELEFGGHQVLQMDIRQGMSALEKQLLGFRPDVVFYQSVRVLPRARLGEVPALLERLHIPYTGSPPSVCRIAQDKRLTKELLQAAGICTPDFALIRSVLHIPRSLPAFPLFVKPVTGGCSFGIPEENPVHTRQALIAALNTIWRETRQTVLVESFVEGREFSIGIMGNQSPTALPIMEFIFEKESAGFRSFTDKTAVHKKERFVCPADLDEEDRASMERLALDVYRIIGCRDYARIDMRCSKNGQPFVLEVNVHPSLLPESSFPSMAAAAGIAYQTMLNHIIASALARRQVTGVEAGDILMDTPHDR